MTTATTSPEEILREAATAYLAGGADYRDSLLGTGKLLHEYVQASLAEGAARPEADRVTREALISSAASALNCERRRVQELVHVGMVAVLLLDAGDDLGDLSWSSVRVFRLFVRRATVARGEISRSSGDGKAPPQAREQWDVVGSRQTARVALLRCAREQWNADQCRAHVATLRCAATRGGPPNVRGKGVKSRASAGETCRGKPALISVASPRDLAESVVHLVTSSSDPASVVMHLMGNPEIAKLVRRDLERRRADCY